MDGNIETESLRTARFALSEAAVIAANRFHWRASFRKLRTYRGFVMLFLLYIGLTAFFDPPRCWCTVRREVSMAGGAALAVFAFCTTLGFVLLPWRVKRLYRQVKAIGLEQTVTIAPDAIMFESENARVRQPWIDLVRWNENERFILLYVSNQQFHLLPAAALDEQARTAIRANLTQAGVKKDR